MLVVIGMLAHFGVILVRFLRRRAEDADKLESSKGADAKLSQHPAGRAKRQKQVGGAISRLRPGVVQRGALVSRADTSDIRRLHLQ